jgi:hypothetical protein
MATNFPSSLDNFTNPTSGDTLASPDHAGQHADANDAIEVLQAKVGVDGSAVTTSLDYKVTSLSGKVSSQSGTTYTLDITDFGALVQFTSNSAVTVTVPPASTEGWTAGNVVTIAQMGTGQVTVQGDTGVTIRTSTFAKTRTQYSVASLVYLGSETWIMSGDMAAF